MLALVPGAARAERAWAMDNKTVLVGFDTERPMFLTDVLLVTGLRPGEQILGIDFRPATVVGDGEAFTPALDGALKYEDGPVPNVTAAAYTNSFAGATTTTLYNIDATKKALVTQAPPNDGVLGMIRPLVNMDFSQIAGFDISPVTNRGYLVMRETGSQRSMLYEIHFTTGDHNPLGVVDFFEQLGALAIEPGNVQPF